MEIMDNSSTLDVHSPEADKSDFPEGGKGWLVIAGCMCLSFSTFGMINSYGMFQTYYETELFSNTASSKLSIIGACQASIIYFFTALMPPMVHAFGNRTILIVGGILDIVAFFGLSTTKPGELWKCYFFQGVMWSIGAACQFTSIMFAPIEWFKKGRALALGLSTCGVSLGGMIWPVIFKNMIDKYGFGWTTRTIAFVYIPLATGSVLLIPQHLEEKYVHKADTFANSKFNMVKVRQLGNTYSTMLRSWLMQMADMRYTLMLASSLIGLFGSYPAIFYLDYFATIISPGTNLTTYLLVIFNALGGPGRILPGLIGDKIGRLNTLFICLSLSGIAILAMWIPCIKYEIMAPYAVFVAIFGFCIGPLFSLFPACFSQVFGTDGSEVRLGMFLFTSTPGPILGCLIAGSFIPVESSSKTEILNAFYKLTIYAGVMMLACSTALLVLRMSINKKPFVFV